MIFWGRDFMTVHIPAKRYELKRLLEGMPFVVCPATPNEIKLLGRAVR